MNAGLIAAIVISGFFTGALARLAVPGPDPMPLWLTTAIGLTGSIIGAVVAHWLGGGGVAVSFTSLGVAIGLVAAYRRFVQHRPFFGPDALRFPTKGVGVEQYRERLRTVGIDPDAAQTLVAPPAASQRLRAALDELHRAGILDDEEYEAKLRAVEERH